MLIFRLIVLLLLVGALLSFAVYIGTRQRRWLTLAQLIVRWTVIAGLAFFAVFLLGRL
ncbi:MAG: hypothetical protein RIQ60_2773 [Pseudomonadota bacterium]|jgi:hypothetical protein